MNFTDDASPQFLSIHAREAYSVPVPSPGTAMTFPVRSFALRIGELASTVN
jgi:hypothetical protein